MPHSPSPSPTTRLRAPAAVAACLLLALAGCTHRHDTDQFAEAVAMGERPVAMKGSAAYFGGQLDATVTISRGVGKGLGPEGPGHHPKPKVDATSPISDMTNEEAMSYMIARSQMGSPLPPVTIRLVLANHGPNPVQVDVQEMNSDLGNFAVEPEVLTIAPGQTTEPNPMISQLGITSDLIPVKVTLAVGNRAESQTIAVKNLVDSADAPPAPPPSP
jgi:hypothetical protein